MVVENHCNVRGTPVFLRRAGSGETLLFLHGSQGQPGWLPALAELANRFDVLAPDHPGFGRSPVADQIDDVSDLAFFYLDLLESLDLEGVHLVGHSIGGWLALEMAIRSTARLKSLSIVSSAGIRVKGAPPADMFICSDDELGALLFANGGWSEWRAAWTATAEGVEIYEKNRAAAAKLSWQPRLFNPKLAKWLHRIDCRTHILWGEDDRVIPPLYACALQKLIPGSTVAIIPGCGHLPHVEQPAVFAAQIANFSKEGSV
jgi:pimeloyl-ACP methyl ester carboxylesterase